MMARTKSMPDGIAQIEGLIGDLETRLRRLKNDDRAEPAAAPSDVNDFVNAAFARILKRMQSDQAADRAFTIGSDAYLAIEQQIERSPLTTLAIAAGIGFLLGSARRP